LEQTAIQIVVACPNCGHGNVFHQPYPYDAIRSNQGFLYNEAGDCTLTWNVLDGDYRSLAGDKYPWALSPEERQKVEDELSPAPTGGRWLFRNPARCLQCGHPISGSIAETPYYLRYDCSVDRDAARRFVPGFKDVLRKSRPEVPWTARDVWFGVIAIALIVAAALGLVFLLGALSLRPNLDLWIALVPTLFELLFLVPVWWFTVHKYHVSLRGLGFRNFKPSTLGLGLGLLFGIYIFNGVYGALLAQFGLQVQTDVTPVLERLATPWPLIFATVIVAPLAEEVFFRGFVFGGLRARYDWRVAAAISAALFAAAHLELTFFIPAFLLGYLFAFLYHRSDSIWPGMILHALVNGFAMAVALSLG
jgi:membrane protease YdiL (CAAX protease family)